MEGVFFYWVTWSLWIYTTFLMKRETTRVVVSGFLLLLISGSIMHIALFDMIISVSFLLCLVIGYWGLSGLARLQFIYLFMVCLTLTLAFVSFRLFEIYDPVFVMLDRSWMLAILLVVLTLILVQKPSTRIYALTVGTLQGELMSSLILKEFMFVKQVIGSLLYLDVLAISCILLLIWSALEMSIERLSQYVSKHASPIDA